MLIAAYCYIIGGDHDFSDASAGISIGRGAWLGAGAKILDGVTIGEHAIVGAAGLVRDDVPPYAVAVGIPARVASTRTS